MPYSDTLDIRITDSSLRDGSHAKGHQFTEDDVRAVVRGARRRRHAGDRGDPRRRPRRLVVQLRLLARRRAGADRRRPSTRPEQAKIAALMLPGLGTKDDIKAVRRPRRLGRSGSPRTAPRPTSPIQHFGAGPRAGPGDGRVPDDGPLAAARGAGGAGPDHGRRRLPVRLRRRLRRRADPGGGHRSGWRRSSPRSATTRRSGFHGHENLALRCRQLVCAVRAGATQIDGSTRALRRRRRQHPARGARRGVPTSLGIRTGIDVLRHHRRRRGRRAAGDGRRVRARPAGADHGLRRRVLELPQARLPGRRALRRVRAPTSCSSAAAPSSSAARRTRSSRSPRRWRPRPGVPHEHRRPTAPTGSRRPCATASPSPG